ncbi:MULTISPECIES: hypothetical protein [Aphanothece]|uniref:hypothetical protein n=1 Tax=Aphanothece TaxID=1121 RepID=UPI0039855E4D
MQSFAITIPIQDRVTSAQHFLHAGTAHPCLVSIGDGEACPSLIATLKGVQGVREQEHRQAAAAGKEA